MTDADAADELLTILNVGRGTPRPLRLSWMMSCPVLVWAPLYEREEFLAAADNEYVVRPE